MLYCSSSFLSFASDFASDFDSALLLLSWGRGVFILPGCRLVSEKIRVPGPNIFTSFSVKIHFQNFSLKVIASAKQKSHNGYKQKRESNFIAPKFTTTSAALPVLFVLLRIFYLKNLEIFYPALSRNRRRQRLGVGRAENLLLRSRTERSGIA